MALKMNGEVPFPLAGEGIFLRFTLRDLAALEEVYGVGEYIGTIEKNLMEGSGSTLARCLECGLKSRGKDGKAAKADVDMDQIDFAVRDAFGPIMDALFLALTNQTYAEALEEAVRKREEIEAEIQRMGQASPDPLGVPEE